MAGQLSRRGFIQLSATAAAGVAATSLLSACGADDSPSASGGNGGGKSGGTLRFATAGGTPNDTVDPALAGSGFTLINAGLLYDTLVRADVDFNLEPALATEWTASPDVKSWTFKIRDGVKFHNGQPLTSKDVAFTMKRILDPKVGASQLSAVQPFLESAGISTPDDTTIKFDLIAPNAFFPVLLSSVAFGVVPDGTTDFSKGVGTGPFVLNKFSVGANASYSRSDEYWKGEGTPYLDAVELVVIDEDATRVQSLLSGSQDLIDVVTGTSIGLLKGNAEPLYIKAGGFVNMAAWGTTAPFSDPRVIDAMKYAQDREKIMGVVAPGFDMWGPDVPVPSTDPYFPPDLVARPYDPEKAKSLLKSAGFGDGLKLDLYAYQGDKLDAAVTYKETAAPAGIDINVIKWPGDTYYDQIYLKKPFIADSWARLHVSTALSTIFDSKSSNNEAKYYNDHLDMLIAEGVKTTDVDKQKQIYGEALTLIDKESSMLIPGWEPQVYGVSNKLKDVVIVNGLQSYFDQAYFA